jgi:glycosyltransferase involved in cell wall biosynthesis
MRVVAIVPAYNEEQRLASTLQAIREIPKLDIIRVVNDGSTDRTLEVARECGIPGVEVVDLVTNVGKGEAINIGVRGVMADVFVFLDGDLGETAREGARILTPVLLGETDLCIAKFPPARKKGGFGMVKRLASWGIAREGMVSEEPLSGQRAMTYQVLQDILPFHSGFGIEIGMTIKPPLVKDPLFRLMAPCEGIQVSVRESGERDSTGVFPLTRRILLHTKLLPLCGGRVS